MCFSSRGFETHFVGRNSLRTWPLTLSLFALSIVYKPTRSHSRVLLRSSAIKQIKFECPAFSFAGNFLWILAAMHQFMPSHVSRSCRLDLHIYPARSRIGIDYTLAWLATATHIPFLRLRFGDYICSESSIRWADPTKLTNYQLELARPMYIILDKKSGEWNRGPSAPQAIRIWACEPNYPCRSP